MKKSLGIYVHIPFCESKCDYCNFVSFIQSSETKSKYVSSLIKEIELQGKNVTNYFVDTIYIGGGTPTALGGGDITKIVEAIKANFNVVKDVEISCEANPNSLTFEKLQEFKNCGINRLSVGLQAYNNRLLKLLNRIHNKKQFCLAIKIAQKLGFKNINADILLGIPTQKLKDVKKEIKTLLKLKIQHISAYGLIVEEGTKLFQNLKNNVYSLPSEELSIKMYDYVLSYLKKHKIFRYEVSNFAKAGYECKHNLKYWDLSEYLGLGLVSSSYFNGYRTENYGNFKQYYKMIENDKLPIFKRHKETLKDKKEELIMLGLRKQNGIDLDEFKKVCNYDLVQKKKKIIAKLQQNNLIKLSNNYLSATDKGFNVLNQIILDLI